jgi:hypothetical protein
MKKKGKRNWKKRKGKKKLTWANLSEDAIYISQIMISG